MFKPKALIAKPVPLGTVTPGTCAVVAEIKSDNRQAIRRRLLDLGVLPGTKIEVLRRSPLGDPTAYRIRQAVIALRKPEADLILVCLRGPR